MIKDQHLLAGNSVDTRRPILTVSPAQRQKIQKRLKDPELKQLLLEKEDLELEVLTLKAELSSSLSPKDIETKVQEALISVKEDYAQEIASLKKELVKKLIVSFYI